MSVNCPLCGHLMNEDACNTCPMGSNCPMVCCPVCGYTTINTDKTAVGRIALSLVPSQNPTREPETLTSLADAPKDSSARVVAVETEDGGPPLQMQAYGLAPGRIVRILQQKPVTVVQADHTELALEDDLARRVLVEIIPT